MPHFARRRHSGTGSCTTTDGRGATPEVVCRRAAAVPCDGAASASANMITVGKRSAGVFSSARSSADSIVSGIDSRTMDGGDTVAIECRAMIDWTLGPVKGGSPTSIS